MPSVFHHTIAAQLSGPDFPKRKEHILANLRNAIDHGEMIRGFRISSDGFPPSGIHGFDGRCVLNSYTGKE